ncbi:YPT52 [[Candida] subhashii]|uniref:YPT52 n=1 Tax=[Candida] subhashii TaxID=561895 RepID=A0A8J5QJE0_9ASCO|nr:YPT52 [[Candida] subhashii]KAG7662171.1 YPT52 [[Candida] subhashii]
MSNNQPDSTTRFAQFKLVLLGESAVGKSSIVHRFVKNTFDDLRESTIGAAFLTQTITIPESNTTIKFEIWDTAGQERYKSLAPMYYRNAHAALCVYDITSRVSFNKAQDWIKELKRQAPEGIVIALVGNKADLADNREVEQSEVEEYIEEHNEVGSGGSVIVTAECSAKTGEGVLDIFNRVGRALPVEEAINAASHRSRQQGSRRSGGVDLNRPRNQQQQQSNSCC